MNPYELNPNTPTALHGRAKLYRGVLAALTKPTPDHVSLVGPRFNGKTMILRRLVADDAVRGAFVEVVYWDLRHATPRDDDSFRRAFAAQLAAALRGRRDDLIDGELDYTWLTSALDMLAEESGRRVFVVLDGIDAVLQARAVTRQVWDNLKALGDRGITFACGSRERLVDLCDAESSTSDFWDMFTTVQAVGPFDESDWPALLAPLAARRAIEESGRKALVAWTGGNPRLVCELLHQLYAGVGTVTKREVDTEAEALLRERHDTLSALWKRECDEETRGVLCDLAAEQPLPLNRVPLAVRDRLGSMGFVSVAPTSLRMSCGLMAQFAKDRGATANHLRRLFAEEQDHARNIGAALELRLAQVRGGDAELRKYTGLALRALSPDDPMGPWRLFRDIVDRALWLVFAAECASDGRLPDAWKAPLGDKYPSNGKPPKKRGMSCRCLDLATGNEENEPAARYVTKRTFVLLDALSTAGDVMNHKRGARMPALIPVACTASLCGVAVELFAAITEEIPLK